MRTLALPALLVSALALACSSPPASLDAATGDAGGSPDAPTPDTGAPARFETLAERSVTLLEAPRRVELIRHTRDDGARTYLLYVHASVASDAPVVISNQPYAGIDWTGEDVDARWAAGGAGLHPDVDAPAYDGDDVINYAPQTVDAAVNDCIAWVANGFACIEVYARFYAGGSLVDDALDAASAYDFALSRDAELDLSRIAAWGGSWGGMMTLEGAARAPTGARPRTIVALAPPSDFADLATWTDVDLPAVYPRPADVEAFFSPYWRRASPDIGRTPSGEARSLLFRPEGLCPALPADTWLIHDEWDTLIPFRQSDALAAACPAHGIWWRRQTPTDFADIGLDHGAFGREPGFPTAYTFAIALIVRSLAPASAPTYLGILHEPALESFLSTVKAEQTAGGDVTYALEPLRAVVDARAQMFDPVSGTIAPGADVVAQALNAVWGTTFDGPAARAQLATGLP